jgi:hypothetical protein
MRLYHPIRGIIPEADIVQLTEIARDGFTSPITRNDVEKHVFDADFAHFFYVGDKLVGFASYKELLLEKLHHQEKVLLEKFKILYLNGIVLKNGHQRRGIFKASVTNAVNSTEPDTLVMRTQSPVVYHAAKTLFYYTFPSANLVSLEAIDIAKFVAERLGMQRYEPSKFLERNTYGCSLYGSVPEVRDLETRVVFLTAQLKPENGDSMMVVCLTGRDLTLRSYYQTNGVH